MEYHIKSCFVLLILIEISLILFLLGANHPCSIRIQFPLHRLQHCQRVSGLFVINATECSINIIGILYCRKLWQFCACYIVFQVLIFCFQFDLRLKMF